jgi:hypothetical protein
LEIIGTTLSHVWTTRKLYRKQNHYQES